MHLRSILFAAVLFAVGTACGTNDNPDGGDQENCDNGVDDTGNGLTDCDDPTCAGNAACASTDECQKQSDCFSANRQFDDYLNDPMPLCEAKKCVVPEASIDMNFYISKNWTGTGIIVQSVNTRLVKKVDVNGEPVTCEVLEQVASNNLPEGADDIEASGRFNLQAYDVTNINGDTGGGDIEITNMSVNTGDNFLIWTEVWSQKKGTHTGLPQGKRFGWGCVDSGPQVAEVKVTDAHPARSLQVALDAPQNP